MLADEPAEIDLRFEEPGDISISLPAPIRDIISKFPGRERTLSHLYGLLVRGL
jgi:hypothetical protein